LDLEFGISLGLCQLALPSCHALKKLSAFPQFGNIWIWDLTKRKKTSKNLN
jgi:hypothetical protein